MRRRLAILLLLGAAALAGGCGAQPALLGVQGGRLLNVYDVLATPGEPVPVRARLLGGDLLSGQGGHVVLFHVPGAPPRAAETDGDGVARVTFAPPAAGDFRVRVEVSPVGLADDPPADQELLVACRRPDAPMIVVDMDRTLVASGFAEVLVGRPEPMADSVRVMAALARDHTIVYLTHRPDYFGPKSKAWLAGHGYPPGPVLLSQLGEFVRGSEAFKSAAIARLRERFDRIEIGIGDKPSDAAAYHANWMKAFLIVPPPAEPMTVAEADALTALAGEIDALPDGVQVVSGWDQIERAMAGKADYPPSRAARRLEALVALARSAATTQPDAP